MGEHDAIWAQDIEDLAHHTVTKDSTGGGVDVSGDVVEDPSFNVGGFRVRIGSIGEGDEHLSPMAEDDLQVGMAVEGSAEDQPQRGQPRLGMPTPALQWSSMWYSRFPFGEENTKLQPGRRVWPLSGLIN